MNLPSRMKAEPCRVQGILNCALPGSTGPFTNAVSSEHWPLLICCSWHWKATQKKGHSVAVRLQEDYEFVNSGGADLDEILSSHVEPARRVYTGFHKGSCSEPFPHRSSKHIGSCRHGHTRGEGVDVS